MTTPFVFLLISILAPRDAVGLIPLIDGGKGMPRMYDGYFNDQIAKQASSAVSRAISAGKKNMEVQFPPVPNVEEAKFGTPLNLKFASTFVARDLKVKGGYKPGSDISRNIVAYSNVYWAKKIAGALKGGALGGRPVGVITAEQVLMDDIQNFGSISRSGKINSEKARREGRAKEAVIACSPGGEETWDRLVAAHGQPDCPFVVLNNAYSTSYGLGNRRGFEEVYYLKRISRGFVFRSFPGEWEALLEKPDGSVEVLERYKSKPKLSEVAEVVRTESFKRYAINNDRWMSGRM